MSAIFNVGNFYFDIISIIAIVIVLISMIVGVARGFLRELVAFGKVILVLGAGILLAKPLGNIIFNTGLGETVAGNIASWLNNKNDLFSTVVTAANREEIMSQMVAALSIPSLFTTFIVSMLNPFVPAEGGEAIGRYVSLGASHYFMEAIAFILIIIVGSIIFALLNKLGKEIHKVPVLGGFDRILGLILGAALAYIIVDALIFGSSFIMVNSDWKISQWLTTTMYLDNNNVDTISKFIFNNSITGFLVGKFF